MSALARSFAIVAGLGLLGAAFATAVPWPPLEMPAGARAESVAGDLVLNGKPCRIARFQVQGGLDEVLQFYRDRFRATRAVETRVKNQPVIATRRGDHFITVQLEPLAGTVRGTIITTALRRDAGAVSASRDTEAWMPADTIVVSALQSSDAGRRSVTVVGINGNSIAANRSHVVGAVQQRGFRLVREDGAGEGGSAWLAFRSPDEDAVLAFADAGAYRTVVVQRTLGATR
jgi:hypothetical protein